MLPWMQLTTPVQDHISGVIRNFFMDVENTLCDVVVAGDRQWLRAVTWERKNAEIPALTVIYIDICINKQTISLMLHHRDHWNRIKCKRHDQIWEKLKILAEKRVKKPNATHRFRVFNLLAQVCWQSKDFLIKAGICRVTAFLLLAWSSKMLSVCSSFPIDTEVWMRGHIHPGLAWCVHWKTDQNSRQRKKMEPTCERPPWLSVEVIKAPLFSNKFEKSYDSYYKEVCNCVASLALHYL